MHTRVPPNISPRFMLDWKAACEESLPVCDLSFSLTHFLLFLLLFVPVASSSSRLELEFCALTAA